MSAAWGYSQPIFPQQPESLYVVKRDYQGDDNAGKITPNSNFLKNIHWSPDGACLLTASDDNLLRVFDLPQSALEDPAGQLTATSDGQASSSQQQDAAGGPPPDSFPAALRVQEGETIYDYCWYPRMATSDLATCCFAASCRGHPLHLWDACTGQLRGSYRGYDDVDEVTAAASVAFSPDGGKLLGGYKKGIKVFDTSRPGRQYYSVATYKKGRDSLPGIVSCMAFSPDDGSGTMLAAGAYSGVVGIFDAASYQLQCLLHGHKGGVTQVAFTRCGNYLLTGARQDPHLFCWDVRSSHQALYQLPRATAATNQRIQFSLDPSGRYLATGGCDGCLKVFDLQTGENVDSFLVAADTVNGCQFHPYLPFLAVASGHRRYPLEPPSDDEGDENCSPQGNLPSRGGPSVAKAGKTPGGWQLPGWQNVMRVLRLQSEWVAVGAYGDQQEASGHGGIAEGDGQEGLGQEDAAGAGGDGEEAREGGAGRGVDGMAVDVPGGPGGA